jgi:multiple sugar transport system permease protein
MEGVNVPVWNLKKQNAILGWKLVFPGVFVIALLIIYPIISNIFISFYDVQMGGDDKFVGLNNYANVLSDPAFLKSVLTSVIYVFATTIGTTLFGLIVAIVMNKEFRFRWLVRSLLLLPYVAPVISVVFAWKFIFDPVNGLFMHITVENLHLFAERFNLIGDPKYSLIVVILFSIWKNFPFAYLMILGTLQSIDTSCYEAADIDGASGWQKFIYITLPHIKFVVGSLMILRLIWNFNKFEEVYLLTTSVKVLPVYTYFKAFTGAFAMGQGAAIALIQFILLIFFILIYVKKVLKW